MVEQEAVNFEVAGSSPASRAKPRKTKSELLFGSDFLLPRIELKPKWFFICYDYVMKIYFVRHGKTDASTGDAISHDDPLNEEGMNQAKEIALQLKDVHFDVVISSPLRRATQTADAINIHHGLPITKDERWRERDLEKYMSLDAWDEAFNFNNKAALDGVEPLKDFFQRVYAALDDLKLKYDSKTVLVTSHGGVHHALYAYANKLPLKGNIRISRMAYCECRIYEV